MSGVGEFCAVCHKWLAKCYEQVFATYEGKGVIVCNDCKRAIELNGKRERMDTGKFFRGLAKV